MWASGDEMSLNDRLLTNIYGRIMETQERKQLCNQIFANMRKSWQIWQNLGEYSMQIWIFVSINLGPNGTWILQIQFELEWMIWNLMYELPLSGPNARMLGLCSTLVEVPSKSYILCSGYIWSPHGELWWTACGHAYGNGDSFLVVRYTGTEYPLSVYKTGWY